MSTVNISLGEFCDIALLNDEAYRAIIVAGIIELRKSDKPEIKAEIERAIFPIRPRKVRKQ